MGRVTARTPTVRWDVSAGTTSSRPDTIAVEEPLEIRIEDQAVVVTMRTPGDDLDLALGFLLAEGLLADHLDVHSAMHCTDVGDDGSPTFNVLQIRLRPGVVAPDLSGRRTFGMTSACGVCGSASIDAVRARAGTSLHTDGTVLPAALVASLPARLRSAQAVFDRTGGLHAAGLFTADATLLAVREDVGRHNATDKVLGWAAREVGWPLTGTVLTLSGRASFELLQKAWMAGVAVVAAVGAPSSLAVEVAEQAGITLVGFVRPPTLRCYSHPQRLR
jgi:FdhD protein